MKRKEGFYWVKSLSGKWEVAEWKDEISGYWIFCGDDSEYSDSELLEIDERQIINPNE